MSLLRTHARVSVGAPSLVHVETATHAYEVANLSVGGALRPAGPILPEETEVGLEILVTPAEPIRVRGRVCRHHGLPAGQVGLGIEFIDVSTDTEARITSAVLDAFRALGARVLGQVRSEMQRRGVTDVALVAEELHRMKDEQARTQLFAHDLFTEQGSNAVATIVSGATGEKRECIVWSLNLYLGLNREPRVIARAQEALARFGTGCGTSAPSGGLSSLHHQIEPEVARMVGKPAVLLFSTGYSANLGALSALPGPKDLLLIDREAHASMFDGARLSGRKWVTFRHNDVEDLTAKLAQYGPNHENVFVAVESAYSMSGDLAPLREIAALKKDFRFFLYVDEAHTFGFYGENGGGYCREQGVTDQVDFIMSTFSKATASIGGFIACEAKYRTLLQVSSSAYIFQACLTPPDAAAILASLEEIRDNPSHAALLHDNNRYMRARLVQEGFDLGTSQSPVIPVFVPDLEKLYRLCANLYLEGIFSVPIVYPAVGVNEGRIRFIVNAHHTRGQIDRTVAALAGHARALGVIQGANPAQRHSPSAPQRFAP